MAPLHHYTITLKEGIPSASKRVAGQLKGILKQSSTDTLTDIAVQLKIHQLEKGIERLQQINIKKDQSIRYWIKQTNENDSKNNNE